MIRDIALGFLLLLAVAWTALACVVLMTDPPSYPGWDSPADKSHRPRNL